MVVILVLGLLVIAVTLASTFALDSGQLEHFQRVSYSRESNYQVARSAFELGLTLLRVDDSDVDGAEDLWATGPQEMTWEGKLLRLEVEDEERRFPINALVASGFVKVSASDPKAKGKAPDSSETQGGSKAANTDDQPVDVDALSKALVRFLDKQGLDGNTAVPALIDWIDHNSNPLPGGSEISNDPRIAVKNARIDSVFELPFIKGWSDPTTPPPLPLLGGLGKTDGVTTGENIAGSDSQGVDNLAKVSDESGRASDETSKDASLSQWSDWLSLYSEGKININTAPREILLCLDEQMTPALVEEIIHKREEGSLASEEDLRKIAAIDEDLLFRLGRLIRYNSQYFRVRISVDSEPGPIRVEAVVQRDRRNPKIVLWEVY